MPPPSRPDDGSLDRLLQEFLSKAEDSAIRRELERHLTEDNAKHSEIWGAIRAMGERLARIEGARQEFAESSNRWNIPTPVAAFPILPGAAERRSSLWPRVVKSILDPKVLLALGGLLGFLARHLFWK